MNDVYNTFLTKSDWAYDHIVPISPDASNRKYFRLTSRSGSAILMDAELESSKSFDAFQDVANYLSSIGLSAPEIYAIDRRHRLMLLQDLGVRTFAQDFEKDLTLEPKRYEAAVSMLCRLQAGPGMKRSVATPDILTEMLNPFLRSPKLQIAPWNLQFCKNCRSCSIDPYQSKPPYPYVIVTSKIWFGCQQNGTSTRWHS